MFVLSTKSDILVKRIETNRQYELSPVHKRYLMCLANKKWNSIREVKRFVYSEKAPQVGDDEIIENIVFLKHEYDIKIDITESFLKLKEDIRVGD